MRESHPAHCDASPSSNRLRQIQKPRRALRIARIHQRVMNPSPQGTGLRFEADQVAAHGESIEILQLEA